MKRKMKQGVAKSVWRTRRSRNRSVISIENPVLTWLDCDTATEGGKKVVKKHARYAPGLPTKNFSEKWIVGADSVRTSKLERVFSTLATIKVDRCSSLKNQSLDDLLLLNSEKIPLANFDPNPRIDLWWSAKTRRPSQNARKQYKKRCPRSEGPQTSQSTDHGESDDSEPEAVL